MSISNRRPFDIVAWPPTGKEDMAHQIINTSTIDLKYLSLSTMVRSEVCEYPFLNKVGIFIEDYYKMDFTLNKKRKKITWISITQTPLKKKFLNLKLIL